MGLRMLAAAVAVVLFGGCSGGVDQTIDRPITEVQAMLESMPASSNALDLAKHLPGTDHRVESSDGRVVWHFTLYEQDYARFIVSLAQKGPQATRVTTDFEEVNDASAPGVPYLREVAKAVSEESVTAALEGRPVDMAALQNRFAMQIASDTTQVVGATRQIWDEAQKIGETSSPHVNQPRQPYDASQPYDRTQPYDRSN